MKKIIMIVIIMMMQMPSMVYAQDTWKPKTPTAKMNFRMGRTSIYRQGYIYTISTMTDATLDTEVLTIHLGNGRQEALESINQLIHISELPAGNLYPFKDIKFIIHDNSLEIEDKEGKFFYGDAYIYDNELKRMKKFIESGK